MLVLQSYRMWCNIRSAEWHGAWWSESPCVLCDVDFSRPADKISYPQQCAVTATGIIWTRFSTVITPVSLLSVTLSLVKHRSVSSTQMLFACL